jgi:hypothetical protein
MKADLTRHTFDRHKHFARVLMQQGRVQLDADWNEQAAILLRYLQALAADLIGPRGGPVANCGFQIAPLAPASKDFLISPGRYYVDGLLAELDPEPVAVALVSTTGTQITVASWTVDGIEFARNQYVEISDGSKTGVAKVTDIDQSKSALTLDSLASVSRPSTLRRVTTYLTQPDYPSPAPLQGFVYLDVWERVITYVEDDSIREVALNGADTAARTKIVWQVKVTAPNSAQPDVTALIDPPNRGFLRARSVKNPAFTDPCTISPNARYTGPENQLYRVEIHTGSTDASGAAATPTFKWSRENGAVVFPIVRASGGSISLESLGRDDRFGLAEGDWVEIQDDDSVLLNRAENLLQVQSIDRTAVKITLSAPLGSLTGQTPGKHGLVRRWDQKAGDPDEGGLVLAADGAAQIPDGADQPWLDLENGVQIQFSAAVAGQPAPVYRTGDYWLIPARTATGDVEWPTEAVTDSQGKATRSPLALPPAGIAHHYAPLATLTLDAGGSVTGATRSPLFRTFSPVP